VYVHGIVMQPSSVPVGIWPLDQLAPTLHKPLTADFQLSVHAGVWGFVAARGLVAGIARTPSTTAPIMNKRMRSMVKPFRGESGPRSVQPARSSSLRPELTHQKPPRSRAGSLPQLKPPLLGGS